MYKKIPYLILLLAIAIASSFLVQNQLTSTSLTETTQNETLTLIPSNQPKVTTKPVDDFSSIVSHIDSNTIVLFDLDDTTFTATSYYGSIDYFVQMLNDTLAKGNLSPNEARQVIYPEWIRSQKTALIKLTDNKLPQYMDEIRKKGIMIYGFTARRPALSAVTINQLNKLGIKFDFPHKKFSKVYKNPLNKNTLHDSEALFTNGVVFCHEFNTKGVVFKDWYKWLVEQTGHKYTKVLLIDDTAHNIESLKEAAKDLRLDYVGLHFNKTSTLFATRKP